MKALYSYTDNVGINLYQFQSKTAAVVVCPRRQSDETDNESLLSFIWTPHGKLLIPVSEKLIPFITCSAKKM